MKVSVGSAETTGKRALRTISHLSQVINTARLFADSRIAMIELRSKLQSFALAASTSQLSRCWREKKMRQIPLRVFVLSLASHKNKSERKSHVTSKNSCKSVKTQSTPKKNMKESNVISCHVMSCPLYHDCSLVFTNYFSCRDHKHARYMNIRRAEQRMEIMQQCASASVDQRDFTPTDGTECGTATSFGNGVDILARLANGHRARTSSRS